MANIFTRMVLASILALHVTVLIRGQLYLGEPEHWALRSHVQALYVPRFSLLDNFKLQFSRAEFF